MASQWSAAAGRLFNFGSYRTASVNDYTDVLVPLDEAYEYSHNARTGTVAQTEYEPANTSEEDDAENGESNKRRARSDDDDDDDDDGDDQNGGGTSPNNGALPPQPGGEYSIEGLRRAVRQATDGKQQQRFTDYECAFPIHCSFPLQSP